jgi:hypothetical protein
MLQLVSPVFVLFLAQKIELGHHPGTPHAGTSRVAIVQRSC